MLLLSWLASCGGPSEGWWVDQLSADGPCYRVDLLDGLDTASTTELHDLFACIDRQGTIRALAPLDAAMDVQTRTGTPSGVEIALALHAMQRSDIDAFALAGLLLDALTSPDRPLDDLLDLSLELSYGATADEIRLGEVDLRDPSALDRGALAPLREVIPIVARTLLEDDLSAAAFAGELVREPETRRAVRTIASLLSSPEPTVSAPLFEIVPDVGDAIAATRSPGNDRWPAASGDSLRDMATFFVVRDNPVIGAISPAAHEILGDRAVREALAPTIDALAESGLLAETPEAIAWMASVDTDGSPLGPGEPSALYRFVRLLADHNQPVDCSIDLVVTTLDWQFDNLALSTLRLISGLEPGRVQDLAGLVTDLTGNPITEPLIDLAVDSGICPSFTAQTLDDLRALEALQQPEAFALLSGFIALLDVVENSGTDHLPELADLVEALFDAGGLEPTEELLRDLGPTRAADDLVALLPTLAAPEQHGITAGSEPAIALSDLLVLLDWGFAVDPETGLTGWQRVRPWLVPVLAHDDGWRAIGNLSARMSDRGSATAEVLDVARILTALDPDLETLDAVGAMLSEPEISGPLLRVAERTDVVDALLARSPPPGAGEVPLAFWGRLVIHGALEDLLRLVDTVIQLLSV